MHVVLFMPCMYAHVSHTTTKVCAARCTDVNRPQGVSQYSTAVQLAQSTSKVHIASPVRSICASTTQQLELGTSTSEGALYAAYRLLLLLQLVTGTRDSRESVLQPLLLLLLRVWWWASLAASAACRQQGQ